MANLYRLLKPGTYKAVAIESARTDNGSWKVKDARDISGQTENEIKGQPRVSFTFLVAHTEADLLSPSEKAKEPTKLTVFSIKGKPVTIKKGAALNFPDSSNEQEMPWSDFQSLYNGVLRWNKVTGNKDMGHDAPGEVALSIDFAPARDRYPAKNYITSITVPSRKCDDLDSPPNRDL